MTDILFKKFRERFPSINGYERITIYEAYERIYLDLIAREFIDTPEFNDFNKVKNLASKTFDVNFSWGYSYYGGNSKNPAILFEPIILPKSQGGTEELMRYNDHYSGHSIEIELPAFHPKITISTGNRGRTDLLDEQREKYFDFVNKIYDGFIENAKLKKK